MVYARGAPGSLRLCSKAHFGVLNIYLMGQFLALELELQGCFLDHSAYTWREKFWFWASVYFCFREKYGQIFIYNVDPLKPNLKIMTKRMWEHFFISNRTMDHSLWKFVNHNHIDKSSKHPPPTGCHRVIKLLAYRHFFWDTWYIETIIHFENNGLWFYRLINFQVYTKHYSASK